MSLKFSGHRMAYREKLKEYVIAFYNQCHGEDGKFCEEHGVNHVERNQAIASIRKQATESYGTRSKDLENEIQKLEQDGVSEEEIIKNIGERRLRSAVGGVYLIQQAGTNLFKIGVAATDLRQRMGVERAGSARRLRLVGWIDSGVPLKTEKEIHNLYSPKSGLDRKPKGEHFETSSEWFEFTGRDAPELNRIFDDPPEHLKLFFTHKLWTERTR